MNDYNEYNPYESMSDLLLSVLIIFILMLVVLSLDVSKKITILSNDNTYSGGNIRPALLLDSVVYSDGFRGFSFYDQRNLYSDESGKEIFVYGMEGTYFIGLLPFIDPGLIRFNDDNKSLLLKIQIYDKLKNFNYNHVNEKGETGEIDISFLDQNLRKIWGNYNNISDNIPGDEFKVIDRVKIHYESIETNGKKEIIIGHYPIDVTNDLDELSKVIFNMLATSLTDFVYLGKYDSDERLSFFEKYGGDEAVKYFSDYLINADNAKIPPFVQYPSVAKKIIEFKQAKNYTPPGWIKEKFLNKIGANLKIIEQK
jgi:hypothetical protein